LRETLKLKTPKAIREREVSQHEAVMRRCDEIKLCCHRIGQVYPTMKSYFRCGDETEKLLRRKPVGVRPLQFRVPEAILAQGFAQRVKRPLTAHHTQLNDGA